MTTVQIVGIAVAAAVVVLLIVALLVTRRRGSAGGAPEEQPDASFLDAAPQDTLAALGKAEQPMEDVTLDPEGTRALHDPAAAVPGAAATAEPDGPLSLDWGPPPKQPASDFAATSAPPVEPVVPEPQPPAPATEAVAVPSGPEPDAGTTTEEMPAAARPEHAAASRKVPLSDIIVTTSSKVIDVDDPEVRHMLMDLVKFEIDQATRYREQGQTIDAVLQLTEAEKISRALGMQESAAAIHTMIQDLKSQI
jgi:hypothetical protein